MHLYYFDERDVEATRGRDVRRDGACSYDLVVRVIEKPRIGVQRGGATITNAGMATPHPLHDLLVATRDTR